MESKLKMALLAVLVLAVAVFLWYSGWKAGQKKGASSVPASQAENAQSNTAETDENLEKAAQEFETKCANGEWTKVADAQGELTSLDGKLRRIYPEDEISAELQGFDYYVEGVAANSALSGADLTALENFEDRDVEVQGAKSADGKSVAVAQVRCAGAETDKSAIDARAKILEWLAGNINSIAPEKASYQQWVTDYAAFIDEKNVYVEYYDTVEDVENSNVEEDTWHKILIEVAAGENGNFTAKVLAYWKIENDEEVLKSGNDKFENSDAVMEYSYNSETKSWERI
jgi:hypothetical protein